jgi:hypothetical protein
LKPREGRWIPAACRDGRWCGGTLITGVTKRSLIVGAGALAASLPAVASAQGAAPPVARAPRRTAFTPGEAWLDTAGKPIQAHGGSIIVVDDAYYWYGENKAFTTGKNDI